MTTITGRPELAVETEPGDVGLSADRLGRIDRHFARYVDDGRLPGWLVLVARRGRIAHLSTYGSRDLGTGAPVEVDTLFRLYSMTKPITSVAAMMLYEEAALDLRDPISRWLPEFEAPRVYAGGPPSNPVTVPSTEPIRVWHLLTHTAGLTYGGETHPVEAMYRRQQPSRGGPDGVDLAAAVERWASLPLLFVPGTSWAYSVATDVLGRLVEVISGVPLDTFFAERILGPLDMRDAAFWVDEERADRLATLYGPATDGSGKAVELGPDPFRPGLRPPTMFSGGGGLIGTARDYHRFTQMLLGGGRLGETRLLGPRTVSFMTRNHLPGGADIDTFGRRVNSETNREGMGFGLGFSVTLDPAEAKLTGSAGEYGWGGAASTTFWVDPKEDLTAVFLTQLMPSSTYPIRPELRSLVYQAIVE
ncbi:MAG TPA: serine hydrolase domain-containing protein [Acidimicrobiales bacterium]|nr:serine hydrolase domain-containing protein [Acidimicrobiales bacterium]